MERINWTERKTNEEILRTIKEKRTFDWSESLENGWTLRHPEQLHNIIMVGAIEGKTTAGRPRNS